MLIKRIYYMKPIKYF